jgi:hypothetical protein
MAPHVQMVIVSLPLYELYPMVHSLLLPYHYTAMGFVKLIST